MNQQIAEYEAAVASYVARDLYVPREYVYDLRTEPGAVELVEETLRHRFPPDCRGFVEEFGGRWLGGHVPVVYGEGHDFVPTLPLFNGVVFENDPPLVFGVGAAKQPKRLAASGLKRQVQLIDLCFADDLPNVWLSKLVPITVNEAPLSWVCLDFGFDPERPPVVVVDSDVSVGFVERSLGYVADSVGGMLDLAREGYEDADGEWVEAWEESPPLPVTPRMLEWFAFRDRMVAMGGTAA